MLVLFIYINVIHYIYVNSISSISDRQYRNAFENLKKLLIILFK